MAQPSDFRTRQTAKTTMRAIRRAEIPFGTVRMRELGSGGATVTGRV
jgi:hypothetical protein